ncbi:hypothetical protein KI387_003966, partial [Taxus chinensis]
HGKGLVECAESLNLKSRRNVLSTCPREKFDKFSLRQGICKLVDKAAPSSHEIYDRFVFELSDGIKVGDRYFLGN